MASVGSRPNKILPEAFHICGLWLSLSVFVMVIRGIIVGHLSWNPLALLAKLGVVAYYDFMIIVPVTAFALASLHLVRHSARGRRAILVLYWACAGLFLLISLANLLVVEYLGTPLSYQWLYHADFLASGEIRGLIAYVVSLRMVLLGVFCLFGMAALALVLRRLLMAGSEIFFRQTLLPRRTVAICALSSLFLYFPVVGYGIKQTRISYPKVANPAVAFVESLLLRTSMPGIFTMETSVGKEDFWTVAEEGLTINIADESGESPIKNVLLVVLESVSAEYLDAYDGGYRSTPNLSRYREQSAVFSSIYAHAPSSHMSLVSILTGTYPLPSYLMLTRESPDIKLHSVSSELRAHGLRTGFFYSSDLRYGGGEEFMRHRGFDVLQDYRTRICSQEGFVVDSDEWKYFNSSHDECTADSFVEWVSEDTEHPFFGVIWTAMTHFPYFVSEEELDFGVDDPFFNRYLNALWHGDRALGKVMDSLSEMGLLESTLVVVTGDHGESFGQHGRRFHSTLYDHGVRVPLILINRQLFDGVDFDTVGGHVDIAPTIVDLLGLPPAPTWQGRSLLSSQRSPRTYFFVPWGELEFGFREGRSKYIFNASKSTFEKYDMINDPEEDVNLITVHDRNEIQTVQERLAAWVQYQYEMISALTQPPSYRTAAN